MKNSIIDFDKEFEELNELLLVNNLNIAYDKIILNGEQEFQQVKKFPKLTPVDLTISIVSAIISTIIDVVFVGTPDVVKLYRGGENFDGSILTKHLRNLGVNKDGELYPVFQWLSNKCKVPYDISVYTETLTPNNHRLRSFAHDPLFGLIFAITDIIFSTTTCIDNNGLLKIIVNDKKSTLQQKLLAPIYYVGHLASDAFTARGLPIPGSFLLEFLASDIGNTNIAKIAEEMYINGYDLRHLGSMSVPVVVKNIVIDAYLHLCSIPQSPVAPLYQTDKNMLDSKLKKCKMKLVSNSLASTGNLLKFILPPNNGNPCAINIVQWFSMFNSVKDSTTALMRNTDTEQAIYNREIINATWNELSNDINFDIL